MKTSITALVLIAFSCAAWAQVFKCKDATGKVIYSDAPCEGGARSSQRLNIDPNANTVEAVRPQGMTGGGGSESPELAALMKRNEALMNQSNFLASKGQLTVGEIMQLKQLRAEQQNVQREMMILRGQDTSNFDNQRRLDKLERRLRPIEQQHNNPVIGGQRCTRYGNNVVCP